MSAIPTSPPIPPPSSLGSTPPSRSALGKALSQTQHFQQGAAAQTYSGNSTSSTHHNHHHHHHHYRSRARPRSVSRSSSSPSPPPPPLSPRLRPQSSSAASSTIGSSTYPHQHQAQNQRRARSPRFSAHSRVHGNGNSNANDNGHSNGNDHDSLSPSMTSIGYTASSSGPGGGAVTGAREKRRSFHTSRPAGGTGGNMHGGGSMSRGRSAIQIASESSSNGYSAGTGLGNGLLRGSKGSTSSAKNSSADHLGMNLTRASNGSASVDTDPVLAITTTSSSSTALPTITTPISSHNHSPITPFDEQGFSTPYGASASSPAGASGSSDEGDYFVSALGEETEVEERRRGRRGISGRGQELGKEEGKDGLLASSGGEKGSDKVSPPLPTSTGRPSFSSRRNTITPTLANRPKRALLPFRLGFASSAAASSSSTTSNGRKRRRLDLTGYTLTRRRCEDGLLLGAVGCGVCKLLYEWEEIALAGEISLLLGLSMAYIALRRCPRSPPISTSISSSMRPQSPVPPSYYPVGMRERSARLSASHQQHPLAGSHGQGHSHSHKEDMRKIAPPATADKGEQADAELKGCIWGTEEREYRECPDDGALFALLLAPLVASAMLHASFAQLATSPSSALPGDWKIEQPLLLPSTPLRQLPSITLIPSDPVRALSALATSRRNLVQLFTLLSFVLLVHLARSLHLVHKQSKLSAMVPASASMERDGSDNLRPAQVAPSQPHGTYWLRRGEWRRTRSVVGFAFLVTACCVGVKVVTAYIGRGVWSDMSPSDIVIATLFYQFSLYVCVRLARRGFTLGELAVVCNAATALFMETTNMTRMKIPILRIPYIKTYRLPTPLLTFQLALIPGSLLTGFLLSPLLYLSRHLAQRPAHRLRFPHEKPIHRRLLALGFYTGAALICGGLVGFWTKWCLNWRDPWVWIARWVIEGRHWWTRPALLAYWGALAVISVAGWNRQLVRARRHRRYNPPGPPTRAERETIPPSHGHGFGNVTSSSAPTIANDPTRGFSQMMDAADQRLPTLSVNARRKFFHALAVVMFVPGIAIDPAFTHLSFSVAFALFNFAEYVRYFALWPFGVSVHLFLNEFLDSKDSGTAILSHFYLLTGCAAPLWLEGPSEIMSQFGVLSLGIGDALASIIGRRIGRLRWSSSGGKTVEGSLAFFASVVAAAGVLWALGLVNHFKLSSFIITTALSTLLEAFSYQNDNLILPMYGWAVGTLLGV